jgi:adenylate kinase family enzyme
MNLQEEIKRIKSIMGLIIEEVKSKKVKPIILIGPQGSGKSTTAEALAEKLNIPLISTDMSMINKKYENSCKDEPGVEVTIKRQHRVVFIANDEYKLCVLNKIMEEYGDKQIVLDVGGTHAYISDKLSSQIVELYGQSPNLFVFNVSGDEDETYEFLKKRREDRGEDTKDENDKEFRDVINKLKDYYKGIQKISIINKDKSEKTTEELVDEIITKLT